MVFMYMPLIFLLLSHACCIFPHSAGEGYRSEIQFLYCSPKDLIHHFIQRFKAFLGVIGHFGTW